MTTASCTVVFTVIPASCNISTETRSISLPNDWIGQFCKVVARVSEVTDMRQPYGVEISPLGKLGRVRPLPRPKSPDRFPVSTQHILCKNW